MTLAGTRPPTLDEWNKYELHHRARLGLTPEFLDVLEDGFKEFFKKEVPGNPLKAEYLIPIFIGELLEQGKMSVKVLKTNDTWYGMTYILQHSRRSARRIDVRCGDEGKKASVKLDEIVIYWE